MKTQFICLANSFKEGGRCLAGIEIDNSTPKLVNEQPKWIRPVCNNEFGGIPASLVMHISILDIVEIDVIDYSDIDSHQRENALFDEDSIEIVGRYDVNRIEKLCDDRPLIFGSKGKAVHYENIGSLDHSLMLIKIFYFEIVQRTDEYDQNRTQMRLKFSYKTNIYDLPITDPIFLDRIRYEPQYIDNIQELFLCLSLGREWMGWYYKLIAGIIPIYWDD